MRPEEGAVGGECDVVSDGFGGDVEEDDAHYGGDADAVEGGD